MKACLVDGFDIMADELIDIFDENNHPLSIQRMKSEAHREGLWHRATHIWIYNSKGEILLQLRAKEKLLYPDMWDVSVAGHVSVGEDPVNSGLRESQEEIGLEFEREDLEFFRIKKVSATYNKIKNNEFYYVYFLRHDGQVKKLRLQNEEVGAIQFFNPQKIEEGIKTDPGRYVPHGNYWFEVIKEVNKRLA